MCMDRSAREVFAVCIAVCVNGDMSLQMAVGIDQVARRDCIGRCEASTRKAWADVA